MTTYNSQDQMSSETNPKYFFFMIFSKKRNIATKYSLKKITTLRNFAQTKRALDECPQCEEY